MNPEQFGKGGLHVEDRRDYVFGASEPFDWSEPTEFNVPLIPSNQQSSLSCVGQTTMNMAKIAWYQNRNTLQDFSARFIYSQIFQPQGGAYGRDGMNILVNQGTSKNDIYPSDPQTETHMRDKTGLIPAQAQAIGFDIYEGQAYVGVDNFNIDEVARAIRDTGSCMVLAMGSNPGWSSPDVRPALPNESVWGHAVTGTQALLRNGKRTIKFLNSWGLWGENGYGYINEDYFANRSVAAAFAFTKNYIKPMQFQKLNDSAKKVFAVYQEKRFWILDWKSLEALNGTNVSVNPSLNQIPYGGAIFVSSTDDPGV